jgi:hypothetical protein
LALPEGRQWGPGRSARSAKVGVQSYALGESLKRLCSVFLAIHLGSEDRVCTTQAGKGSRLVGKVYNLCRVLKTGISVELSVKSSLRILFD